MEQFRQIGEVVGSLKALMIFEDDIQINQRQCCLLVNMLTSAYNTIADEMKKNLRFDEKSAKWKVLENPLRELLRVFKEGEIYIKQCLDIKDWWARAFIFSQNKDCIEFHIHNLLCYLPMVIEAIEIAGEISGTDQEEMMKKRYLYSLKYHRDCKDPKIFQWKYGNQYLISQDICNKIESVWDEDRWILVNRIKSHSLSSSKNNQRLADVLLKNLNGNDKLPSSSLLLSSKDYQVRRRIGSGSQYKEIQWLGESFALRHFFGDSGDQIQDISRFLSLSHPNIMNILCGFKDEERKEYFLIMELMNRDLSSYVKEICGPKKRIPFSLPVAVDLMLQIARGMEYLHSKKIYHGELNPNNILLKSRNGNLDGYMVAKVAGFGHSLSISFTGQKTHASQNGQNAQVPFIWYAPEVLAEQEYSGNGSGAGAKAKYTEKADVYSFGMICFQLLTGKVPFEDTHLQGDKMSRNIRSGERPLFPFHPPKYVTNITKKCWHNDPNQRPSFSSICRILRYIKKFLVMNPETSQQEPPLIPLVDFNELEAGVMKSFPDLGSSPVTQVPFQLFAYKVAEKEKFNYPFRETSESGSDGASAYGDENVIVDDPFPLSTEKKPMDFQEIIVKRLSTKKKSADGKSIKHPGTPTKGRSKPPQANFSDRSMRLRSEHKLMTMSPRSRRTSGHVSDSELDKKILI